MLVVGSGVTKRCLVKKLVSEARKRPRIEIARTWEPCLNTFQIGKKVFRSDDLQKLTSELVFVKFCFFREIEMSSERIFGPVLERYAKAYARATLFNGSSARIFILGGRG
jgi:hypothetical protein